MNNQRCFRTGILFLGGWLVLHPLGSVVAKPRARLVPQLVYPQFTKGHFSRDGKYRISTGDEQILFQIFDRRGRIVSTWYDPELLSVYSGEPGAGYSTTYRPKPVFRLFPRSRKFVVVGGDVKIIDFDGRIVARKNQGRRSFNGLSNVFVAPGGKRLAFGSSKPYLYLVDQNLEMVRRVNTNGVKWVAFAPDGKTFALAEKATPGKDGFQTTLRLFDHNGKFLRVLESEKTANVKKIGGGKMLKPGNLTPSMVRFSPDGRWLSYNSDYYHTGHIILIDLKKNEKFILKHRHQWFLPLADEQLLLFQDPTLTWRDLDGSKDKEISTYGWRPGRGWYQSYFGASPDGKWFHLVNYRNGQYRSRSLDKSGDVKHEIQTTRPAPPFVDIRLRPDGEELILTTRDNKHSYQSFIWDLEEDEIQRKPGRIRYNRDGEKIVHIYDQGKDQSKFMVDGDEVLIPKDGFMLKQYMKTILPVTTKTP